MDSVTFCKGVVPLQNDPKSHVFCHSLGNCLLGPPSLYWNPQIFHRHTNLDHLETIMENIHGVAYVMGCN